jgi:pyruvate dehydrogenase E2 component (dihydrolipoamide acetyltransferase)
VPSALVCAWPATPVEPRVDRPTPRRRGRHPRGPGGAGDPRRRRKGIREISRELGAVSAKARDGKLGVADLQGGCFTISSLGGIGGTGSTPIVNAPEVAILGVVRARTGPVWDGAALVPRLMLPISLSYDHRVIDGALAARFARSLCQLLEDIRGLLL